MRVKIYSTEACGYCRLAKNWFESNEIEYTEILLDNKESVAEFMKECPNKKTVPQILIDQNLIEGGYKGLMENKEEVLTLLK